MFTHSDGTLVKGVRVPRPPVRRRRRCRKRAALAAPSAPPPFRPKTHWRWRPRQAPARCDSGAFCEVSSPSKQRPWCQQAARPSGEGAKGQKTGATQPPGSVRLAHPIQHPGGGSPKDSTQRASRVPAGSQGRTALKQPWPGCLGAMLWRIQMDNRRAFFLDKKDSSFVVRSPRPLVPLPVRRSRLPETEP